MLASKQVVSFRFHHHNAKRYRDSFVLLFAICLRRMSKILDMIRGQGLRLRSNTLTIEAIVNIVNTFGNKQR